MMRALLLVLVVLAAQLPAVPQAGRTIAITIDDLPTASVLGNALPQAQRTTAALVAAITREKIPAIGFVNERKLWTNGKPDPARVALLQQWIDAGLELGNHTFGHVDLHRVDVKTYTNDITRGEQVTRKLLESSGRTLRFFRHPFLHTGTSLETRRAVDAFLKEHGYTVAPITVDNYDYIFAAAYDKAIERGDAAQAKKIADAFVEYIEAAVAYYEQQSQAIVGREIAQTLLLHANALNAATLDRVAARLRARGYRFVSLAEALKDPAYQSRDEFVGTSGISWLHRWALTAGKRGIFAGEPEVPDWIQAASR